MDAATTGRVLVTGGAVRLGRALVLAFARAGFDTVIHHHSSSDAARAVADEVRALGRTARTVRADLSTAEGCAALAEATRGDGAPLDVLVNSAGLYEFIPAASLSVARWDRMLAVNCRAPFLLTRDLLESLRASGLKGGALVLNITDIAAERPVAGQAHYSVAKAGLLQLTRALALELAPRVRVNAIAPGHVLAPEAFTDERNDAIRQTIPLRRIGTAADVAEAAVFLATRAPFVTGQAWAIDGGSSIAGADPGDLFATGEGLAVTPDSASE